METGRQVFSVDLLERYAAKGHGVITCMAAGNDVIVLGTSKGWIIRHDFGVGDSYDIDLSTGRAGEQSIHRVFVDPGGCHCIATIVGGGGADTFYTHAKWTRPRVLSKLNGLVVNAVAWNRQQITEASTREVILGTDNGQLHEIAVDEKDKKEKHVNFLFELKELPEAFMGLQMETASTSNGTKYYMMAVTPTRLYSFSGIGSLDTVFASYVDRPVRFMELPATWPLLPVQLPRTASSSRGLLTLFPDLNESTREKTGAVVSEPQPNTSGFAPLNFPMRSVEHKMAVQTDIEANQYTLKSCVETMTAVTNLSHRLQSRTNEVQQLNSQLALLQRMYKDARAEISVLKAENKELKRKTNVMFRFGGPPYAAVEEYGGVNVLGGVENGGNTVKGRSGRRQEKETGGRVEKKNPTVEEAGEVYLKGGKGKNIFTCRHAQNKLEYQETDQGSIHKPATSQDEVCECTLAWVARRITLKIVLIIQNFGAGILDSCHRSWKEHGGRGGDLDNDGKQRRAVHFTWLSRTGIHHGGLNFGAQHSSPEGNDNFVENKGLLDYSKLVDVAEAIKPNSLAVSEFHFLLLLGNKVKVVNRISEQIIEELQFDETPESMSRGIIGLCSDASAGLFYAYDQNSIFQVSVNDEGRDMWKVYLDLKEYAAALANCRDPFQRDQVYLAQAEAAFSAKDFLRAASFYAKIYYILSFEEITLKFISVNEQDALRTFLLRKLDNLSKDDKCQITMISTWATELYLDKINRLLLEDDTALENRSSEYHSIIKEFRAFLSDCKDVLDEATTMNLLESYGRVDELVYFASLKEQYEIVVHHYIQQGEAKKALEVLQKPAVPIDLQYKFAPDLIMLDAYETVESWMTTKNLNPRKLIPAMMRYSSEPHAKNETHEVIKYLEFCVHRLQNEDPGVHNLLLSLYAKQEDNSALLPFLQCKFGKGQLSGPEFFYDPKYALRLCLKEKRMRACVHIYSMMSMHEEAVALALQEDDSALLRFLQCKFGKGQLSGPEFFYDPKYALRLCLKEKRMRACVHIYSMMSMHEEAVALALQVDPELAKAEADKVEDDEDLRKKLWLMVAKHVVEQEKGTKRENIRKAIAFLKETDGLLKIEDILPFFPDFALIDDFKGGAGVGRRVGGGRAESRSGGQQGMVSVNCWRGKSRREEDEGK
ncbi:hypothetical protein TEA_021574 [Camellia sinensis var. sinensis]|uniref:Pep3/Vps18 beta-propeller domain-containing protein n=1 Tax=Camellia sinensis var. sinensis TaxID=542762 RepID=A0A4S4ESW2_CAMSN|nr:hypothetical protein TEA_021574 [Camellia sinensis var. sinensis]